MYFVQLKLFSLPGLAACGKYKVTANEGVVVRRAQVASFTSLAVGHSCCAGNKRNSTDSIFPEFQHFGELPPLHLKSGRNLSIFSARTEMSGNAAPVSVVGRNL